MGYIQVEGEEKEGKQEELMFARHNIYGNSKMISTVSDAE